MQTKSLKNTTEDIELCAKIIRDGGLVAFPTETVYGLGANGFDGNAVRKIFAAKGRPQDNPLILHIHDVSWFDKLYTNVPKIVYALADAFMPGPLTIIYNKSSLIPQEVSAKLDTVAVRIPGNECARELIMRAGVPIAAPSANKSGRPSPTCAAHVYDDLAGNIDAILDGGECTVGVESTVITLAGKPQILRPGGITKEMLECIIPEITIAESVLHPLGKDEVCASPGMKYKHYAPNAEVYACMGDSCSQAERITAAYDRHAADGKHVVILASEENAAAYESRNTMLLGSRKAPETFCNTLFAKLRLCDDYDIVLCETISEDGIGLAFMNRLLRACAFKSI